MPSNPAPPAARDAAAAFFFGTADQQLFACFHPPQDGTDKSFAVLLCYPSGRDYVFVHRAFRRLAIGLSRAGFPVLRFDYCGCGDSSGDGAQGGVPQWSCDIVAAIDELKSRSGRIRVCLVGFRLGASLAALVGARLGSVEAMVLWDPVIDGSKHVDERVASHARWARTRASAGREDAADETLEESLGFPMTAAMRADKRALDLQTLATPPAARILLLSNDERPELAAFGRRMSDLGAAVDWQRSEWPEYWRGDEMLADILMPPVRILQAIVDWTVSACP